MGHEIEADFNLNNMPDGEAQRLHDLIRASNFFEIPAVDVMPSGPDEFAYTITIVSGNSIHTVRVTDNLMPRSLRPLIQDLTALAVTH